MTRYNLALLSLLASTVSAVPHYGQHGHRHPVHIQSGSQPSGISPSGGFPTVGPTAPYGQGNSTTLAPAGSAPVSSSPVMTSVVTVVPQPIPSGSGSSPVESSGVGNSPVGGSSAAGGECGPATVTVTSANTVTVTVPASSTPAESTPIESSPVQSTPVESMPIESPVPVSSAPFGNGTTAAPIGTGTAGTGSAVPSFTPSTPSLTPSSTPSLPVIPVPSSSPNGYQSPSVAHPVPLASSIVENSPETAATSTTAETGQNHQAQSTPATSPSSASVESSPEQAPAPSSTVANSPEQASPSSSPSTPKPSTAPAPSTDNVVPRGLVYNEASLTSHFDNANVGWLYNWDSTPGGTVDTSKEFVPMLWDVLTPYHTPRWAENADAAIAAGAKHLLAFNEPDLPAQANMNVGQSVQGWKEYMEPFHEKHNGAVKLGSPSVCNGPDQNQGLAYLSSFLASCDGCHVDFLAIHWYGLASDEGVQNLKDHIGKATDIAEGRPIWLTEFQPLGSDEQQAEFLNKILPWLDDKSNGVERYALFKVDVMVNGNSLTQAGAAYAA
ncbi:MAG: hypothetical protein L6R39_003001 [Caloplaca ligustica]|nr:MAG: hypothetical protein L6R39_003001 [Caloplaca ligustica]